MNGPEKDIIDFESDIATWVIDKEDSDGSHVSNDGKAQELQSKTMNKENIKHYSDSPNNKSLRFFRIIKNVSYKELSSESDSDSKRKLSSGKIEYEAWNKKIRSESHTLKGNILPKANKPHHLTPSSSPDNSNDNVKDNTICLSSDEISQQLSLIDDKTESSPEKREKLHSIENVSMKSESKEKVCDNNSPSSVKFHFMCSVCDQVYLSLDDLILHENIHKKSSADSHQTLVSPLVLANEDKAQHFKKFESPKKKPDFLDTFKDHLLSNGLISSQDRKEAFRVNGKHNGQHLSTKKIFTCQVCNFNSSKMLECKVHEILFHSKESNLNCDYCNYTTNYSVDLAAHMNDHLKVCSLCNYQCLGEINLEAHVTKSHSIFKCNKCNFTCESKRKLSYHLKQHAAMDKFKCEHCKLSFSLKLHLKKHIEKQCLQSKQFKCAECDMCFSRKDDLKCHIRSHRDLYICYHCKKEFFHKGFLRLHLRWHDKETFKCQKCDSSFSGENYLKLHMRTHKSKEFKCKHCNFLSNNSSEISKHICIDTFYDVQKRSLNFMREKSECEVNTISVTNEPVNNDSLQKTSLEVISQTKKNKINIPIKDQGKQKNKAQKEIFSETISDSNKDNVNNDLEVNKINSKFQSLRQNLPSRTNHKFIYKTEKINGDLQCFSKTHGKLPKVTSKKICNKNLPLKLKETNCKQNYLLTKSNQLTKIKKNYPMKHSTLKKHYILKDLDCLKTIFLKKTTLRNLLVDPVRFVAGSFVECYYQNHQPSPTPPLEHLERHLRQRTLLSCRLCHYKTNSQQLLQRHTAENHTWDRAILSTLFS